MTELDLTDEFLREAGPLLAETEGQLDSIRDLLAIADERIFDAGDLTRAPGLLGLPDDVPPARAVHVVEEGLIMLCPELDEALYVLFWESA